MKTSLFLITTLAFTVAWAYGGKFNAYKSEKVSCGFVADNGKRGAVELNLDYLAGAEPRNLGLFRVAGEINMTMPLDIYKRDANGKTSTNIFDKKTLFRIFNSSGPALFSTSAATENEALADALERAIDSSKYSGVQYLIAGSVDNSNAVHNWDTDTFVTVGFTKISRSDIQATVKRVGPNDTTIEAIQIDGTCQIE
jgi:hypothetical protein